MISGIDTAMSSNTIDDATGTARHGDCVTMASGKYTMDTHPKKRKNGCGFDSMCARCYDIPIFYYFFVNRLCCAMVYFVFHNRMIASTVWSP